MKKPQGEIITITHGSAACHLGKSTAGHCAVRWSDSAALQWSRRSRISTQLSGDDALSAISQTRL